MHFSVFCLYSESVIMMHFVCLLDIHIKLFRIFMLSYLGYTNISYMCYLH